MPHLIVTDYSIRMVLWEKKIIMLYQLPDQDTTVFRSPSPNSFIGKLVRLVKFSVDVFS